MLVISILIDHDQTQLYVQSTSITSFFGPYFHVTQSERSPGRVRSNFMACFGQTSRACMYDAFCPRIGGIFGVAMELTEYYAGTSFQTEFAFTYTSRTQASQPPTEDFRRKILCIPRRAALTFMLSYQRANRIGLRIFSRGTPFVSFLSKLYRLGDTFYTGSRRLRIFFTMSGLQNSQS